MKTAILVRQKQGKEMQERCLPAPKEQNPTRHLQTYGILRSPPAKQTQEILGSSPAEG